jgi:hypothetical protein
MVSGLKGATYEEKLEELDMLTLKERKAQADMVQVFKILHRHDNVDKGQWFNMACERGVRTRLATGVLNLTKPRCNTEIRANFFSVRVKECWNKVHFKKAYRNFRCSRPRP